MQVADKWTDVDPVLYEDIIAADKAFAATKEKSFKYYKEEVDINREAVLELTGPRIIFHADCNHELQNNFVPRYIRDVYTSPETSLAERGVQTPKRFLVNRVVNHVEGGFDRRTFINDHRAIDLFKKRFERSKGAQRVAQGLSKIEAYMYGSSFVNMYDFPLGEEKRNKPLINMDKVNMGVAAIIPDPWTTTRPIVDISWNPKDEDQLAVAYCNHRLFAREQYDDRYSFIWNTRDGLTPVSVLDGGSPITALSYNSRQAHQLAGGLMSGQICLWDIRVGPDPVHTTQKFYTFFDLVTCMQWINPSTGFELTVGGLDGQVLSYDIRNWSHPMDQLFLDMSRNEPPDMDSCVGATSLFYDWSLPTKMLVGTTAGTVVIINKKGKSVDRKISKNLYNCHGGPVLNVERNPNFLKYFLTIGDWLMKIWCDDLFEEPIVWTNYGSAFPTCAVWSKIRNSVIVIGKDDGNVEVWDYLERGKEPTYIEKVSDYPIRKVAVNNFGQFCAAGGDEGILSLFKWSRNFGQYDDGDSFNTVIWLERETRREKLLEGKLREMRLQKRRLELQVAEESVDHLENAQIRKATGHFNRAVQHVIQKRGEKLGLWEKIDDDDE